jgi:hypothetical protein
MQCEGFKCRSGPVDLLNTVAKLALVFRRGCVESPDVCESLLERTTESEKLLYALSLAQMSSHTFRRLARLLQWTVA